MNVTFKLAPLRKKNYIGSLIAYRFASLPDLILALFENHPQDTRGLEEVNRLLYAIGYRHLKDIPHEDLKTVRGYVRKVFSEWLPDQDTENKTYLLLAALQRRELMVIIDHEVVNDLEKAIYVYDESVINFIDARTDVSDSFITV